MKSLRLLLVALAAALLVPAASASAYLRTKGADIMRPAKIAQTTAPLAGTGENMEIVANVPVEGVSEIEVAGNFAYIASDAEGVAIIDISNPRQPVRAGSLECPGGFGDIDVNAEATLVALGNDSGGVDCLPEGAEGNGSLVVDVTDKSKPKVASFIQVPVGSHTNTFDGKYLYTNNYDPEYRKFESWDLSDPTKPKLVGSLPVNGTASHDLYVDHRPDGKVLVYSASVTATDVIDVTDPANPVALQRIHDPEVTISHQAEPNHKRDLIIVSDEFGGGAAGPVCGKTPAADPTYMLPVVGATQDYGAISIYPAAADGTFENNGVLKAGTMNIPIAPSEPTVGCTSHVFWQAPDQNRLVAGWYQRGTRVFDFTDPAATEMIGWFVPNGDFGQTDAADTWAAKPHNGYIFTGDITRGMDVLRFTGQGWPATAGPAEGQRFKRENRTPPVTTPPATPPAPPAPARQLGRFAFRVKARIPGRRGRRTRLTFTVTDGRGAVVSKLRFSKPAGRTTRLRASGVGTLGSYRYVVRVGDRGRVLKRGRLRITRASNSARLPADRTLVCRVR